MRPRGLLAVGTVLAAAAAALLGWHGRPAARAPVATAAAPPREAAPRATSAGGEAFRSDNLVRAAVRPPAAPLQGPPAPRVVVLEFHQVLPVAAIATLHEERVTEVVSVDQLGQEFAWLRERGYHVVGLPALERFLAGGEVPPRAVVLTFDDGYESFYEYVYPLLRQYGFPATCFLVGAWLPQAAGTFTPLRNSYLAWSELRAMAPSGLVDVEAHTWDMHRLVDGRAALLLAPAEARRADLARVKAALEQLGRPVTAFAYPYGAWSPEVIADLRATGYRLAFVAGGRPVLRGDDPMLLPRVIVGPGFPMEVLDRLFGVPAATSG
jgi:peptidoglycan/xylan/chitin deacetylase (PgdA/CDA1 family)